MSNDNNLARNGEMATFTVKVLYRQNATWQGTVTWLDRQQTLSFRSLLELIHLMDSVFDESNKSTDIR